MPKPLDEVTIHIRGRRINGRVFDNSYTDNEPRTRSVPNLIPGLREAVLMMQPGAKWEIYIPPELAYRRKSPLANQAVIVELELLSVNSGDSKTSSNTTPESEQDTPHP